MKQFYPVLKKSCKSFFRNFKPVLLMILVDITFFVSFALVYAKLWEKIMANVTLVMDMMEVSLPEFADVQTEAQLSALAAKSSSFMIYYKNIGYYLGMLFVAVLVMWCIFQGVNWFLANDIIGKKKEKFLKFIGKFSLLTVIWWALFLLIISLYLKLSAQASMDMLPVVGSSAASVLAWLLLFVLFYFAYTSYALMPGHKLKHLFPELLKTAYTEYKTLVPVYLFTALLLALEYLLFMKSFAFGGVAAGVFAVVIIFPTIAWTRFYAITALEK